MVTGAAGGIGSAIVRAFVEHGARVVAADIDEDAGQDLVQPLKDATFMRLDVTDEASWVSAFARLTGKSLRLDVLVNNAGYFAPNVPFEEMSLALWRRHFAVNADSVFLGCKHALIHMRKHGGAITNLASSLAVKPNANASAYCASKAAVLMTTRTAALSGAAHQIRVNAVLPGPVETPMLLKNAVSDETSADLIARFEKRTPLAHLTTKEEIANAVLFLSDPANHTLTGATLAVDAGITLT